MIVGDRLHLMLSDLDCDRGGQRRRRRPCQYTGLRRPPYDGRQEQGTERGDRSQQQMSGRRIILSPPGVRRPARSSRKVPDRLVLRLEDRPLGWIQLLLFAPTGPGSAQRRGRATSGPAHPTAKPSSGRSADVWGLIETENLLHPQRARDMDGHLSPTTAELYTTRAGGELPYKTHRSLRERFLFVLLRSGGSSGESRIYLLAGTGVRLAFWSFPMPKACPDVSDAAA